MKFESTPAISERVEALVWKLGHPDAQELAWNLEFHDDHVYLPDDAPQYYVDLLVKLVKQAGGTGLPSCA
ncbi:MAG: hypothetical protein WC343_08240 [Bacilli bacterium]|jgi:hypothetical protein